MLTSLRSRMVAILAAAMLVPATYATVRAWTAWHEQTRREVEGLVDAARLIAAYQDEQIEATFELLAELSTHSVVRAMQMPACAELLHTTVRQNRILLNIALADAGGTVRCGSNREAIGISIADREYFRRILAGEDRVASEVLSVRTTGRRSFIVGRPIRGEGGVVQATLVASFLIERFTAVPERVRIASDAAVLLLDREGVSLRPADAAPAPAAEVIARLREAPGSSVRATLPDGRSWLYVLQPLAVGGFAVVVGVPGRILGWLDADLLARIAAPTLLLLIALAVIWLALDRLVVRHLTALAAVAQRYRAGELQAVPELHDAPAEIDALGRTMAQMAATLAEREQALSASLAQKELLLREIHHRVKNNLQIVTSLLNLRAGRLASPVAREALAEAQTRIKALALVHRNLYEQADVGAVDLSAFVDDLCGTLADAVLPPESDVTMSCEADPLTVPAEQAISLSLLITEALSNAFKHGFPEGRVGRVEVRIAMIEDGARARLSIRDDGVGIAEETRRSGLGMTLIEMLARQAGGELAIETGPSGTALAVTFVPGATAAAAVAA